MEKRLLTLLYLAIFLFIAACGDNGDDSKTVQGDSTNPEDKASEAAYNVSKDESIQEFNLREREKRATQRFPGDTLELMAYVIKNYPKGSYLIDFDRTSSQNIPQSAVIYEKSGGTQYIIAMIAKSKEDDLRLIESKNVIGYDASFIDLDSTELGTAFFYLTLFKYEAGTFSIVWEAPVPSHGGFNKITLETWPPKKLRYIRVNFHFAQGSGHIDYNYFLVRGLTNPPHFLMTYEGINMKRTMGDVNKDSIPDYFEHIYYDTGNYIFTPDSVAFIWKDSVYINTRNPRQKRYY